MIPIEQGRAATTDGAEVVELLQQLGLLFPREPHSLLAVPEQMVKDLRGDGREPLASVGHVDPQVREPPPDVPSFLGESVDHQGALLRCLASSGYRPDF